MIILLECLGWKDLLGFFCFVFLFPWNFEYIVLLFAASLTGVHLYVTSCFPLAAFKVLSLIGDWVQLLKPGHQTGIGAQA